MSFIRCFYTFVFTFLVTIFDSYSLSFLLFLFSLSFFLACFMTHFIFLYLAFADSLSSFFLSTSRSVFELSIRILQYHQGQGKLKFLESALGKIITSLLSDLTDQDSGTNTSISADVRTLKYFSSRLKNTFRSNVEFDGLSENGKTRKTIRDDVTRGRDKIRTAKQEVSKICYEPRFLTA